MGLHEVLKVMINCLNLKNTSQTSPKCCRREKATWHIRIHA